MAAVNVYSDGRVVLSNIVGLVTTWCYLDGVEFDTGSVSSLLTGPQGPSAPAPIIFRAYRATNLTGLVAGWQAAVPFDVELVDSNNAFNGTKFQPTKAGWYRVTGGLGMGTGNDAVNSHIFLTKNAPAGAVDVWAYTFAGSAESQGAATTAYVNASGLVYLNGTTDYVECRAYLGAGGTIIYGIQGQVTFFEAEEVAPSVRDAASVDPWHSVGAVGEPAFTNSWANYGAPFNTAGFWKDSSGVVHLRGLITGGTVSVPIFTLPVGYRPAGQEIIIANAGVGVARLDVRQDGSIIVNNYIASGTNGYVSLDSITFKAA